MELVYDINKNDSFGATLFSIEKLLDIYLLVSGFFLRLLHTLL